MLLRQLVRQTVRAASWSAEKEALDKAASEAVLIAGRVKMEKSLLNRPIATQGTIADISIDSDLIMMDTPILESVEKRITRKSLSPLTTSDRYALDILRSEGAISEQSAAALGRNLRSLVEGDQTTVGRIWTNPRLIHSASEFEAIPPGHLVAFSPLGGGSGHVIVSLGDGRFVGIDNHVLNASLGTQQRIVLAEQFGEFSPEGIFRARRPDLIDQAFEITSGEVSGSNPAYLTEQADIIRNRHQILSDHRVRTGKSPAITRVDKLLGADGLFIYNQRGSTLLVQLHSASLGRNMNGIELADAIDALAAREQLDLAKLRPGRIDLVSCGAGVGGPISTAQIVADRTGVAVNASARVVRRASLREHPERFSIYTPGTNPFISNMREGVHLKLDNAIRSVRRMYRTIRNIRVPRSIEITSAEQVLLASIVKLIDNRLTVEDFIRSHDLNDLKSDELRRAVRKVRTEIDLYFYEEKCMDNAEDVFVFGLFDLVFAFAPITERLDLIIGLSHLHPSLPAIPLPTNLTPTRSSPAAYR